MTNATSTEPDHHPSVATTTYRISQSDYIAAGKLFSRLTKKAKLILLALVPIVIAAIWFGGSWAYPVIGGVIGGVISWALIIWIINPWSLRRHYRQHPMIHEPISVALDSTGVHFSSSYGSNLLAWVHIIKWRHNDLYVMLYQSPRVYHLIPKRIADDGFDLDTLLAQLHEKVGVPV